MHEGNRACWNGWGEWWETRRDEVGVWKLCHERPELVLSPGEFQFMGDLRDKKVCVLASGDNEVAFAMAGMGARVTSIDISEGQLAIAEQRSRLLGLDISLFVVACIRIVIISTAFIAEIARAGLDSVYRKSTRMNYSHR